MAHLVDDLADEARAAIASMREAALRAREVHACAELMRHMLTTARDAADRPREEAVEYVVHHWLEAWGLDRSSWPHVAEMERFAGAFHDYARDPSDAHDIAVRAAAERLEQVFTAAGVPLADRMAWRSECAHGWWAVVVPAPPGEGRVDRDWPRAPFWEDDCPAHCR